MVTGLVLCANIRPTQRVRVQVEMFWTNLQKSERKDQNMIKEEYFPLGTKVRHKMSGKVGYVSRLPVTMSGTYGIKEIPCWLDRIAGIDYRTRNWDAFLVEPAPPEQRRRWDVITKVGVLCLVSFFMGLVAGIVRRDPNRS